MQHDACVFKSDGEFAGNPHSPVGKTGKRACFQSNFTKCISHETQKAETGMLTK